MHFLKFCSRSLLNVKPFGVKLVLAFALVQAVGVVHAAYVSVGPFKVTGIERNWGGDLLIWTDQNLVIPGSGCGVANLGVSPKTVPSNGWTVPDTINASLQALAITALSRNSQIKFVIDTSAGCVWGVFPVIVSIQIF